MTEAEIRSKFEAFILRSKAFPANALGLDEGGAYEDTYVCFAYLGFEAGVKAAAESNKSSIDYGWIEWRGGAMPVEKGSAILVRHRDGEEMVAAAGYEVASEWGHFDDPADIVAYRVM